MRYQDYVTCAKDIASEIFESHKKQLNDSDDWYDIACEYADNSEYVIYYSKAWDLVNCLRQYAYSDYQEAETNAWDSGRDGETLDQMVCRVAFEWLVLAIVNELDDMN